MAKKIIAIDYDDVIVSTASDVLVHYKEVYGISVPLKDFYSRDPTIWGADNYTIITDRVNSYLLSVEYQRKTKPSHKTIDILRRLSGRYELHIITGRPDILKRVTTDVLEQYLPNTFESIVFTNFHTNKPLSKADVCKDLNATVLIDDHLHHAEVVAQCGIKAMLFGNYPWNDAIQLPKNIQRVSDWSDVERLL